VTNTQALRMALEARSGRLERRVDRPQFNAASEHADDDRRDFVQRNGEITPFVANTIQRQLGHANLGTTSVYLQGTEEIIATVHGRRAPMIRHGSSSEQPIREDSAGHRSLSPNDRASRRSVGDGGLRSERRSRTEQARAPGERAVDGRAQRLRLSAGWRTVGSDGEEIQRCQGVADRRGLASRAPKRVSSSLGAS
jgi:hypothetical protein